MDGAEATDLNSAMHGANATHACVGGRAVWSETSGVSLGELNGRADLGESSNDSIGIFED